ncbi:MAG: LacI family DNA-binding transcriptional regulator [Lentisphaeria bacterium]|nr:LacI family DNA-binding transcriptional regulator [Lentisphaeria bacterium]
MMKNGKRITIREVAEKSGVSTATVSRVLNGEINFPEATRKKIWAAAHLLGYEPSIQARKLRAGVDSERLPTNLIMYIFNLPQGNPIGDRYTADSAQMFDWLTSQRGYYTANYRYFQQEGFHCPLILDRLVDGAVIGSPHQEVIECVAGKVPTVLLNVGFCTLFPEIPRISAATEPVLRDLMLQARELGHVKAALIGSVRPIEKHYFALDYISLIHRLTDETGFELKKEHCYQPQDLCPANNEQRMDEIAAALLSEIRSGKVTLVFGEDYTYAKSIYSRLLRMGVRIPEEISIITVNSHVPFPTEETRILTSAVHDWKQLYIAAIEVLKDLIAKKDFSCREFMIPAILCPGKTLGRPIVRLRSKVHS